MNRASILRKRDPIQANCNSCPSEGEKQPLSEKQMSLRQRTSEHSTPSSTLSQHAIILQNWHEAQGKFRRVSKCGNFVKVKLSCGNLVFHEDSREAQVVYERLVESEINEGERIGVLKTDDPSNPIGIRRKLNLPKVHEPQSHDPLGSKS